MSATRPCDNKKFYIYSDGTYTHTQHPHGNHHDISVYFSSLAARTEVFVYFGDTKLSMTKTLKEQGLQPLGVWERWRRVAVVKDFLGHSGGTLLVSFWSLSEKKKRERPRRKTKAIVQLIVIILQHFAQV